jgi:peptide/nickel transport system substrate-binding protein
MRKGIEFVARRDFLGGAVGSAVAASLRRPAAAQGSDTTLTWGEDFDFDTLDPRVSQSRHEAQVIDQIFEALVFLEPDGKLHPWLAERWEYARDGKSITFFLRKDVKFHDGTRFDAQAVKFTFDSIADPKLGSQAAVDFLGPYRSTEVVNEFTVRVNWTQPYGPALTNLSNPWLMSIVSPAAVQKLGNDGFARSPVGTGPFKFVEWVPRQRVVLERFDDYKWAPRAFTHQGPARIKRVVIRIIRDAATRVSALEKGEIDIADGLPAIEVKRFQGGDYAVLIGDVAGMPMSYMLNTSLAPLNDLRVRQALISGINRPAVVNQVYFGSAKPAYGPLTASTPGYWPGVEKVYPFDLAKARQLLTDAGWTPGPDGIRVKEGKPLELTFVSTLEPDLGVAVQAAAKDIGFKVNIQRVTQARRDELLIGNEYHLADLRWVAVDPSILKIPFASTNIPAPGKFKFNWARFSSPEVDRLLREADAEVDQAKRSRFLADIQRTVLEQALLLPLNVSFHAIAHRKKVQGLRFVQGNWQILFYEAQV